MNGRTRGFDKVEALEEAMYVFWKKGFHGAALSDLCDAMGINKPSVYAAFGNKEALFLAATDHYIQHFAQPQVQALYEDGDLADRIALYMKKVIENQCACETPQGCYISLCLNESASESMPEEAAKKMYFVRDYFETQLTEFFTKEQQQGALPSAADPAQITRLLVTFLHGTASMARVGAKLDELLPLADNIVNAVVTVKPPAS